jgi:hypothetical protein
MASQWPQMTARKGIVLDANILLRAVFGRQVLHLLETYEDKARFYAPDVSFQDALKYIPLISKRRGFDAELRYCYSLKSTGRSARPLTCGMMVS